MSSKYDVIKLKVHLPNEHFYILSRFLLSKMLLFCKVPEVEAIKIALDVKRHFVNTNRLDTTQEELEAVLRDVMLSYGFGALHAKLLPVITTFYTERVPLVLLIAGGPRTGKTAVAQLLASRLNCSSVLNTEILKDAAEALTTPGKVTTSSITGSASHETVAAIWRSNCRRVYPSLAAEISKALDEGKVLIAEGTSLDLTLYREFFRDSATLGNAGIIIGVLLKLPPKPRQVNQIWGERKQQHAVESHPCEGRPAGKKNDGLPPLTEGSHMRSSADLREDHVKCSTEAEDDALATYQESGLHSAFDSPEMRILGELKLVANTGNEALAQRMLPTAACTTQVWKVSLLQMSDLLVAADTLHALTVSRMLSVLLSRGRLDRATFDALNSG